MDEARAGFLRWLDRQQLPRTDLYPCPYLPGRNARQYGFAAERLDSGLYLALMDRGFRRSGRVFYAMDCPDCDACVPLRVPVATFRPSRSQRRTLRRNRDVRVEFGPPALTDEAFALYRRYLRDQHPDTPADEGRDQLQMALYDEVVDTVEARYVVGDRLIGVSILDVAPESLSAVYHYFDPDERRRRVGVFSALREIEHARALGATHYYLGYWIAGAPTMHYKADYRPHELLLDGTWLPGPRPGGAMDGHAEGG